MWPLPINWVTVFDNTAGIAFIYLLFKFLSWCFSKKQKKENFKSLFEILEITTEEQCSQAIYKLTKHCESLNALGFDCEWVSYYERQPVALLQLASPFGFCCLFRLNVFGYVPLALEQILSDHKILKIGVNTSNDANLLWNDYGIQVKGVLDLRHLYPMGGSLASLARSEANMILDKTYQCSNWEAPNLSDPQKEYAAKDALAGVEIFKQWLLKYEMTTFLTEEDKINRCSFNLKYPVSIKRFLDIPYKAPTKNKLPPVSVYMNNQKKFKSVYVTRKSPLYHNCFMHAPDGELLCSCDKRKAEWYVERGLAEVLPGDPYSIRLLFEPAARAGDTNGGRYYQQLKQNCCVVCGTMQSYLKHNVVPKEYRKHFPTEMKDHQSHDIVLLCITCHHLAAQHNDFLRQQLAIQCNAPITGSKIVQDGAIQKVKNSAKALIISGDVIPVERKNILENEIKKFYKVNYLSLDLLQEASNLDTKTINKNYESHGIRVVNYYIQKGGGLMKLETLWREHFLKTMNPEYLPALWSVTHNHSRLAAKAAEKQV